jgi:hypothetical protein
LVFFKKRTNSSKPEGFGKVLLEFPLEAVEEIIESCRNLESLWNPYYIEGLQSLVVALGSFLNTPSQWSTNHDVIKLYDTIRLESSEILRASGDFQGKEWFSNITVTAADDQQHYRSDEGAWYGKVSYSYSFAKNCLHYTLQRILKNILPQLLLLLRLLPRTGKNPYDLALVCWYDIHPKESDVYGCLQLYYTEEYNIIPIDSIDQEVHIVPQFDKENLFLLNKYMF